MNFVFLLCTEPGPLEAESLLLARSIRRFGGRFRNASIFSLQPRDTGPLRAQTLRDFSACDVAHLRIRLNTRHHDYPVANKALVAAWAERHLDFEIYVMLDSDKLVLAEPALLELTQKEPIALRPVHQKLAGTTGDDDQTPMWAALYAQLGLSPRFRVETTLHGERIWGYWNSGLVACRRGVGLYARWQHHLERLLNGNSLPDRARYFADQLALAMAIDENGAAVRVLPRNYNYPIAFHNAARSDCALKDWNEIVTAHYHKMFYQTRRLRHPLDTTALTDCEGKLEWLREELHRTGVYPLGPRHLLRRGLGAATYRWRRWLRTRTAHVDPKAGS